MISETAKIVTYLARHCPAVVPLDYDNYMSRYPLGILLVRPLELSI